MRLRSSAFGGILGLAALWAIVAVGETRSWFQEPASGSGAEYEVFSAVLRDGKLTGRNRGDALVVRERSVDPRRLGWWDPAPAYRPVFDLAKRVAEADASTISSYNRQNDSAIRFEASSFHPDLAVSILSDKDFTRLFESRQVPPVDVWKPFYEAFPRASGIIDLSRVGFSADGAQALVYIGRQSHLLDGAGFFVLLRHDGSGWRIQRVEGIWVS